ncbi:hypothetical protein HFO58_32090 [Rhizobium leguminosarum]|uniref:hypothetical protein n=1 Tax=Rhizobium leguminosarum TaxID=384 RepID=UPI001C94CD3D|nr:hypothetical protein [Rhizobium leguminosarum]MBY5537733.1 hypothetical protein [Rhizobium leguminosarum]
MKRLAVIAVGMIVSMGDSSAFQRLDAKSASCEHVRLIIASDGAAVLRSSSTRVASLTLYRAYVRSDAECISSQDTRKVSVETADETPCELLICRWRDSH